MVEEGLKVKFSADVNEFAKGTDKAMGKLVDFNKVSNSSTIALSNLSRVAQDAPYGFLGIANNLNPLLESFQRLQAESGGTKQALSALVAGLSGPAGIGLALGVVSSLLVKFGGDLFNSGKEANAFVEELKKIDEASKNAGKSIQNLVGDLQFLNQYSSLSINIAGGNDQAVLRKQIRNNQEAADEIVGIRQGLAKKVTDLTSQLFDYKPDSDERKALESAIATTNEEITNSILDVSKLTRENALLDLRIKQSDISDQKAYNKEKEAEEKKRVEAYKRYLEAQEAARQAFIKNIKIAALNPDFSITPPEPQSNSAANLLATGRELNERANPDNLGLLPDKKELDKMIGDATSKFADFQKKMFELSGTISGVLTPAFQNLFANILAGQEPIQNFFKAIGQSVMQLINQLIAAAIEAAILSLLTGGAGGGADGKGLSFIGAFKKITGFASGGLVYGPTMGMVGEGVGTSRSNPEVIAPLDQLKKFIGGSGGNLQPVFVNGVLRGRDIHLQATRQRKSDRRRG